MGGNITAYENPDDPKNIKAARYQNINIILQSVAIPNITANL